MEFFDLIEKRYSVRRYRSDTVEDEKLQIVLDAARLAPTAVNKQPFKLIIIKTEGNEDDLRRIYPASWFVEAPIVICACALPDEGWTRRDGKNYSEVDAAIAMDHLILAATSLGLGTCWVGAFDEGAAREILNIPDNVIPLIFTPLGYPASQAKPEKIRKKLENMVRYEKYG